MGLYKKIKNDLPNQFSVKQFAQALGYNTASDYKTFDMREVRNLLKQFHLNGYITRISKNMYEKVIKCS